MSRKGINIYFIFGHFSIPDRIKSFNVFMYVRTHSRGVSTSNSDLRFLQFAVDACVWRCREGHLLECPWLPGRCVVGHASCPRVSALSQCCTGDSAAEVLHGVFQVVSLLHCPSSQVASYWWCIHAIQYLSPTVRMAVCGIILLMDFAGQNCIIHENSLIVTTYYGGNKVNNNQYGP